MEPSTEATKKLAAVSYVHLFSCLLYSVYSAYKMAALFFSPSPLSRLLLPQFALGNWLLYDLKWRPLSSPPTLLLLLLLWKQQQQQQQNTSALRESIEHIKFHWWSTQNDWPGRAGSARFGCSRFIAAWNCQVQVRKAALKKTINQRIPLKNSATEINQTEIAVTSWNC